MNRGLLNKLLAVAVTFVFFTTQVAQAAQTIYTIQIPEDQGKVSQRWKGEDGRIIIHIQDAHANLDAQVNLARIICELLPQISESENPFVGIEGAIGSYDLKELRDFPLKDVREAVGQDFVKNGKFIGAEYASIIADRDFTLYGLEDTDLFRQDYNAFYNVSEKQDDIEKAIEEIEQQIEELKELIYGKPLKKFDESAAAYEKQSMQLIEFLKILYPTLDELGIDLMRYVSLMQFKEIFMLEQGLDRSALEGEIEKLVNECIVHSSPTSDASSVVIARSADGATKQSQDNIRTLYSDYKAGKVAEREMVFTLMNLAISRDIALDRFPNIEKLTQYYRKFALIDFNMLMREILKANNEIRNKLATTKDENLLVELWRIVVILKQLVSLKVVREDVSEFRREKMKYSLPFIYKGLEVLAQRKGITMEFTRPQIDFEEVLTLADEFYTVAEERNTAMLDNLLSEMDRTGQTIGILVAGGFHSDGIVDMLKERNISYLTIAPRIDELGENVAYMDRMMGAGMPQMAGGSATFAMSRLNASLQAFGGLEKITAENMQAMKDFTVFEEDGRTFKSPAKIIEYANAIEKRDSSYYKYYVLAMTLRKIAEMQTTAQENGKSFMDVVQAQVTNDMKDSAPEFFQQEENNTWLNLFFTKQKELFDKMMNPQSDEMATKETLMNAEPPDGAAYQNEQRDLEVYGNRVRSEELGQRAPGGTIDEPFTTNLMGEPTDVSNLGNGQDQDYTRELGTYQSRGSAEDDRQRAIGGRLENQASPVPASNKGPVTNGTSDHSFNTNAREYVQGEMNYRSDHEVSGGVRQGETDNSYALPDGKTKLNQMNLNGANEGHATGNGDASESAQKDQYGGLGLTDETPAGNSGTSLNNVGAVKLPSSSTIVNPSDAVIKVPATVGITNIPIVETSNLGETTSQVTVGEQTGSYTNQATNNINKTIVNIVNDFNSPTSSNDSVGQSISTDMLGVNLQGVFKSGISDLTHQPGTANGNTFTFNANGMSHGFMLTVGTDGAVSINGVDQSGNTITGNILNVYNQLTTIFGTNANIGFNNMGFNPQGQFGINFSATDSTGQVNQFGYGNVFNGTVLNSQGKLIPGAFNAQDGFTASQLTNGINAAALAQSAQALTSIFGANNFNINLQGIGNTFNISLPNGEAYQFTMVLNSMDQINLNSSTLSAINAATNALTGASIGVGALATAVGLLQGALGATTFATSLANVGIAQGMSALTFNIGNIQHALAFNGSVNVPFSITNANVFALSSTGIAQAGLPQSFAVQGTGVNLGTLIGLSQSLSVLNAALGNAQLSIQGINNNGQVMLSNAQNTQVTFGVSGNATALQTVQTAINNAFAQGQGYPSIINSFGSQLANAILGNNTLNGVNVNFSALQSALQFTTGNLIPGGVITLNQIQNNGNVLFTINSTSGAAAAEQGAQMLVNATTGQGTISGLQAMQTLGQIGTIMNMIAQISNATAIESITFNNAAIAGQAQGQYGFSVLANGAEYTFGMNNGTVTINNVGVAALSGALQARLVALGINSGDSLNFISGADGNVQFTLANGKSYVITGNGNDISVALLDALQQKSEGNRNSMIGEGSIVRDGITIGGILGEGQGRSIADIMSESNKGDSTSSQYRDIVNYVGDQVLKTKDAFGNRSITTIYFGTEADREYYEANSTSTIVINADLIERVLGKTAIGEKPQPERDQKLNFQIMEQVAVRSSGADEKLFEKKTFEDFMNAVEKSGIISEEKRKGLSVRDENGNEKKSEEALIYIFSNIMKRVVLATMRADIMDDKKGEKGNAISPEQAFKDAVDSALKLWGNVIGTFGLGSADDENSLYTKMKNCVEEALNQLSEKKDGLTWDNILAAFNQIMDLINNLLDYDSQRAKKNEKYISDRDAAANLSELFQQGTEAEAALKNLPEYYVIGNDVSPEVYDVFKEWIKQIKEDPKYNGKTMDIMRESAFEPGKNVGAIFAIGNADEKFGKLEKIENVIIRRIPASEKSAEYGLMLIRFNMVRYEMLHAMNQILKNNDIIKKSKDESQKKEAREQNKLFRDHTIDTSTFKGIAFCEKNRLDQIFNAVERLKQNIGLYVTAA
jgi:hypothetical protein